MVNLFNLGGPSRSQFFKKEKEIDETDNMVSDIVAYFDDS